MHNAMIIDSKDNVAEAIEPIKAGDAVTHPCGGGGVQPTPQEDIPIHPKLGVRGIAKGGPVVK